MPACGVRRRGPGRRGSGPGEEGEGTGEEGEGLGEEGGSPSAPEADPPKVWGGRVLAQPEARSPGRERATYPDLSESPLRGRVAATILSTRTTYRRSDSNAGSVKGGHFKQYNCPKPPAHI